MKATRLKSVSSHAYKTNRLSLFENEERLPTPKDFDNFLPWLCLKFEVPILVIVERCVQEEYKRHRRTSATRSKIIHHAKKDISGSNVPNKEKVSCVDTSISTAINAIRVKAYYNQNGNLVEVAFIKSPCQIYRKVIRLINLCLPFHASLRKFTIKGGGLAHGTLLEIGKLLPYSNITEICLDDNDIAEGNYEIILESENQLQSLSLRRCNIDDEICKRIANKLKYGAPASNTLLTLDLTSNQVTDVGAQALGAMLRTNRTLVHLSIADNKVTDVGANYILSKLQTFNVTKYEFYEMKRRYLKYCREKEKIYKQCEKEIIEQEKQQQQQEASNNVKLTATPKSVKKQMKFKAQSPISVPDMYARKLSLQERAELKTIEIVGKFRDIFDKRNVTYINDQLHSIGNLKLCSLNFAYNNLGYLSVRKLYEVLKYQSDLYKPDNCKGLLRVVVDGNNIPKSCKELNAIESYLDMAITDSIAESGIDRSSTSLKSCKRLVRNIH